MICNTLVFLRSCDLLSILPSHSLLFVTFSWRVGIFESRVCSKVFVIWPVAMFGVNPNKALQQGGVCACITL